MLIEASNFAFAQRWTIKTGMTTNLAGRQPKTGSPKLTTTPHSLTSMKSIPTTHGAQVLGPVTEHQAAILSPEALEFFAVLQREFNPRRIRLLRERKIRQAALD